MLVMKIYNVLINTGPGLGGVIIQLNILSAPLKVWAHPGHYSACYHQIGKVAFLCRNSKQKVFAFFKKVLASNIQKDPLIKCHWCQRRSLQTKLQAFKHTTQILVPCSRQTGASEKSLAALTLSPAALGQLAQHFSDGKIL
jgi:hypothetical protein